MARRWTRIEEKFKRQELVQLYIKENKTIGEIAKILHRDQSTIYDRLIRLGMKPDRSRKVGFNNKRNDISIPSHYSRELSEFVGILLGDGHITPTQVTVTLGNKEIKYVEYVAELIRKLFGIVPKTIRSKDGYYVVYFGSTNVVRWFLSMGLVFNKVKNQVDVPSWIFSKNEYMRFLLRGFFDTDGSIYKLKFGVQLSFTNRSLPMLYSLRKCLLSVGFYPSQISTFKIYVTRREDIIRFFGIIKPSNTKHQKRFLLFTEKH